MFQEYPKWVAGVIVQSAEEESALLKKDEPETADKQEDERPEPVARRGRPAKAI